jgi:hypothetical protein
MGTSYSGYRDRDLSMHKFMCFANMSQCTKILAFVLDVAETQVYNQGTNMRLVRLCVCALFIRDVHRTV